MSTKLPRRTFLRLATAAAALPAASRIARAQSYPSRPVRFVVGFAPGGGGDLATRLMAQWLSERLGQQFVVENRVGASSNLATEQVVRAPADGYTLIQLNVANAINASLYSKLSFDVLRDLAPVASFMRVPNVMEVGPTLPVKTVPEFIAYAKANPGKVLFASSGVGTTLHRSYWHRFDVVRRRRYVRSRIARNPCPTGLFSPFIVSKAAPCRVTPAQAKWLANGWQIGMTRHVVTAPCDGVTGQDAYEEGQPMTTKFTDALLRSYAKPQEAPKKIWDPKLPGFGFRVSKLGTITFVVMKRPRGQRGFVNITLGRYPTCSLAEARTKARKVLCSLEDGVDPREQEAEAKRKAAAAKASTFANVAEAFIARHIASKRSAKSIEQLIRRNLIPVWGERPITSISRAEVIALIDAIVDRGHPEAAHSTLAYIKRLFSWAVPRYDLEHAPTDHVRAIDVIGARAVRQRVLTDDEIRLIWRASENSSDRTIENGRTTASSDLDVVGSLARLLLLLGVRRSELGEAVWSEFDLDNGTWIVPAARMKAAAAHVIPLPPLAVEILRTLLLRGPLPRPGDRVFRVMHYSTAKKVLDANVKALNGGRALARWRWHDCRRTMRTGLSTIGIAPHIAELCIAHTQKGLAKVYDQHRYGAEKRAAFEAWERRLLSIVMPPPDNVVALKRKKSERS
jgi:integrase